MPAVADNLSHLELLRLLEQHPEYTQRQLAEALGVSLGKTHYLLKALLDKGSVKVQNFQRSPNKLGHLYRLTAPGIALRMKLTQTFLTRKEQEYLSLRKEITLLRAELGASSTPSSQQDAA